MLYNKLCFWQEELTPFQYQHPVSSKAAKAIPGIGSTIGFSAESWQAPCSQVLLKSSVSLLQGGEGIWRP